MSTNFLFSMWKACHGWMSGRAVRLAGEGLVLRHQGAGQVGAAELSSQ